MTNGRTDYEIYNRKWPPERWQYVMSEVTREAHTARMQAMREFISWLVEGAATFTGRTIGLLRQWVGAYRAWRTRRAAIRELQGLDNRMLRDMGIARSEIEWLVAGGDQTRAPRGRAAAARKPCVGSGTARKPQPAVRKRAA